MARDDVAMGKACLLSLLSVSLDFWPPLMAIGMPALVDKVYVLVCVKFLCKMVFANYE